MKFMITAATNFIRIFCLPDIFPEGYCFQGGYPVNIQLIDWFNPFDVQKFWNTDAQEFESTDEQYQNHIDDLRKFIKEKCYFDNKYTYLAITDYGDSFTINAEHRRDELQKQYDEIRQKFSDKNERKSIQRNGGRNRPI